MVAGLSGAGKTTTLTTLADLGYYSIDNLPVSLFPDLIELSNQSETKFSKTVLQLDIDSSGKVSELLELLSGLGSERKAVHIIFLDCRTENIVKRYSETRRPHPGFQPTRDHTLEDAISRERQRLQGLKSISDIRIDTSDMNVHDLKREVRKFEEQLTQQTTPDLRVNFMSFGFKYGPPFDCDLIIDVRFLPNPHHVEELRCKTGQDSEVKKYVLESNEAKEFLKRYYDLLQFLLPLYIFEGKAYLNIGVGCTGGKHRSVAIAEALHSKLNSSDYFLSVNHRDILR